MKMKQAAFILLGLLFALQTQAQYRITGIVADAAGKPLAGAAVTVKEMPALGAVADAEGRYEIQLPGKGAYTLCASFVGYEPAEERSSPCNPPG